MPIETALPSARYWKKPPGIFSCGWRWTLERMLRRARVKHADSAGAGMVGPKKW